MNNDWKPTEQNIGQPVLDTYSASVQNNTYIQPQGTLYIGTKWYDVDTTKLTSIKHVEALFSAIGLKVSETNENFDKVKHLLIIPEKPKTLDEIQQEFDEKIDALMAATIKKFDIYKQTAEHHYNRKFDGIIKNFEYAKEHGQFPLKYTIGTLSGSYLVSSGSGDLNWTAPNFVVKQGSNHKGYYTFGNQRYFRYYMPNKPNFVSRFFMDKLLGFKWIDEKTSL